MEINGETVASFFVLFFGVLLVLRPDIGAFLLRKTPFRYGGSFHRVPEEKKVARPFFVRLMGFALIVGGFLLYFHL